MQQFFCVKRTLYEEVLQRFVGVIDAKLLETVDLKILKAKEI